tara:strand:+ start:139 stop:576 length:438 start_codon:yes stop_codon:yes gene_type:complete
MAANQRPVFSLLPINPIVNLSVANTSNAVVASPADATDFRLLYTCAKTDGAKVGTIGYQWIGTGTPAAGILNIWITDTSGANARVRRMYAFAIAAGAISTTVQGSYVELSFLDFQVSNGQKIFVSVTTVAANTTLNVFASIGEFN